MLLLFLAHCFNVFNCIIFYFVLPCAYQIIIIVIVIMWRPRVYLLLSVSVSISVVDVMTAWLCLLVSIHLTNSSHPYS